MLDTGKNIKQVLFESFGHFIGKHPLPKAQLFYFNKRNGIEDEKHFLIQCMEYDNLRQKLH